MQGFNYYSNNGVNHSFDLTEDGANSLIGKPLQSISIGEIITSENVVAALFIVNIALVALAKPEVTP